MNSNTPISIHSNLSRETTRRIPAMASRIPT